MNIRGNREARETTVPLSRRADDIRVLSLVNVTPEINELSEKLRVPSHDSPSTHINCALTATTYAVIRSSMRFFRSPSVVHIYFSVICRLHILESREKDIYVTVYRPRYRRDCKMGATLLDTPRTDVCAHVNRRT